MTSFTIQSFVNDVKPLLDVAARSKFTDAQLAHYAVDGLYRLYSVRPSSRYNEDGTLDDVVFPTADNALLAFSVKIDERWRLGVVYFAAARAHECGVTDTVNLQLAQSLKQQADAVFAS